MNIILLIFASLGGVVAVLLLVGLFTKKSYIIQRAIVIDKACPAVFNYVKYLRNQDYYSKWVMTDPAMKKNFKGTDGTPGFVYAWDSQDKNAGKGEQEILKIKEGERVDIQIRFERPFKGVSDVYMATAPATADQTKVDWVFGSSMKYPMNIAMLFMNFDKVLGADMETSLSRLKNILESKQS